MINFILLRKQLCRWFRVHKWVTIKECDHEVVMCNHKKSKKKKKIPCKWRYQLCENTDLIRLQSNFGNGWVTEEEYAYDEE